MFRKTLILLMLLLTTGCVSASVKINLNKDDSGTVVYKIAYEEKYIIDNTFDKYDMLGSDFKVEAITYEKNGKNYIGREISFSFKNLEEFNQKFNENLSGDGTSEKIAAIREKNTVTIKVDANKKMYENYVADLNIIDYKVIINVDGRITENNATNVYEKTLEWDLKTILKDGLLLEYDTSINNMLLIPLVLTFIATTTIYLVTKKK